MDLKFGPIVWATDSGGNPYFMGIGNVKKTLIPVGDGDYSVESSDTNYAHIRGPREGLNTLSDVKEYVENCYKENIRLKYESYKDYIKMIEEKFT